MSYENHNARVGRSDFVGALGDAIRQNPVPAALVGAGIFWLFAGGRDSTLGSASLSLAGGVAKGAGHGGRAAYHAAQFAASEASDGIGRIAKGASQVGSRISDRVSETAGTAGSAVADLAEQGKQVAARVAEQVFPLGRDDADAGYEHTAPSPGRRIQDSLADLFAQQPLLIGAIGLAIGAGIAASMPRSDTEDRLLGTTADEARRRGEALWEQAKQRGSEIATRGMEEAKTRKLTPEGAADAARTIGTKLAAVTEHASKDLADRIKGTSRTPHSSPG